MRESRGTGQFLTGHRKGKKDNTSPALPETGLTGSSSQPSISHQETEMVNADEALAARGWALTWALT